MLQIDLCVILDIGILGERDAAAALREVLKAGVRWIQYRDKESPDEKIVVALADLLPICRDRGARLIINDRAWLVKRCGADGVHLGQGDMPVGEARGFLGQNGIIGCSVRSVDEARKAKSEGADYLGVGAIYPTDTKADATVVGLSKLAEIGRCVDLPVIAVGGIDRSKVKQVLSTGACGVAVASAVLNAPDVTAAASELLLMVKRHHGES